MVPSGYVFPPRSSRPHLPLTAVVEADTFLSNKLVRIDIATSELEEYNIPYILPPLPNSVLPSDVQGRVALACVVQPGKDGNVYAAAGVRNEFVRINPQTKKVDVFYTNNPLGNLQPFNDAWPGETGVSS